MYGYRVVLSAMFVAVSTLVPSAAAWNFQTPETLEPSVAAWTLWGRSPGAELPGDLRPAVACALGDVNGDDVGDLLVRVHDPEGQLTRVKALAGPDFSNAIWELPAKGQRELHCAPDLNVDGAADPVMSIVGAASTAAGPGQRTVDRAVQVLDGTSGGTLLRRQHQDTDTSAGSGGVAANASATAELLPAAAGAEAFVKTEVQQSALSGLPASAPVSSLTATARHAAELQLLDAKGTVQGVVSVDTPGVDPLSMAPLPMGLSLPDVAVLTAKTVSPVQEASQRIPTLSRFNPDGTLAWAVELSGTQGLPILIPRAGDLDLDGVEDLIVETAQTGLGAGPASQFVVLSGIDGSQLLASGPPIDGVAAALPLGSLPTGEPAILSAVQADGAAKLTLSALKASGQTVWSVDVEPGSMPINVLTDSYTGDPLGFADLTGDGLPDIGLAAPDGRETVLQIVNGADGSLAWTTTFTDVERIVPVPARDTFGKVTSVGTSHLSDLMVVGNVSQGPNLTLVRGATGEVVWRLSGELPPGTVNVDVVVQVAGDLDADGIQDLLTTLDPGQVGGADESIYAISGADGATLWANTTDASQPILPLSQEKGPAFEERAKALSTAEGGRAPLPGAALMLGALALAVGIRRRLR